MKYIFLPFLLLTVQTAAAAPRQLASLPLGQGLTLPYYTSAAPAGAPPYQRILIAIQGYTRDATRTFDAAAQAAANAGQTQATLIIAPIFQVPPARAKKCSFHGVAPPTQTDALWKCGTWSDGSPALNGSITSFTAMDRLLAALTARYPTVHTITIAGFSAGGQYVQRYIGFANPPPGPALRYVVADPSGWLYFDATRPLQATTACPDFNNWKFGTENLPATLNRTAADAKTIYAKSDTSYLEGALDTGTSRAAAYQLLEKSCGAERQGAYRLDRGEHYAAYDLTSLAHGAHPLTIVPGCAHSVTCVFPSQAARAALFGRSK